MKTLFGAPTAIRAIKTDDPYRSTHKAHDLSILKAVFLAEERCDPNTLKWVEEV
jgi:propionyl-CoA synthetase